MLRCGWVSNPDRGAIVSWLLTTSRPWCVSAPSGLTPVSNECRPCSHPIRVWRRSASRRRLTPGCRREVVLMPTSLKRYLMEHYLIIQVTSWSEITVVSRLVLLGRHLQSHPSCVG